MLPDITKPRAGRCKPGLVPYAGKEGQTDEKLGGVQPPKQPHGGIGGRSAQSVGERVKLGGLLTERDKAWERLADDPARLRHVVVFGDPLPGRSALEMKRGAAG